MDFRFTEKEERLRQEIRDFARKELPPDWAGSEEAFGDDQAWEVVKAVSRKLAQRGWLTMAWPREYGGGAASQIEQTIYQEEAAYWGIHTEMGVMGVSIVGPTLMLFGTEEQKREHLPPISRGERYWCTGYSEPGAGSDLASLQTRAVRQGDEYVVNGQKIWTSGAHRAEWCWLACRTDPQAPKHKGISLFLCDMRSPGITVRPLFNAAGHHYFNEVFFDDVHLPARNRVGEENQGWYLLAVALDFERSGIGFCAGARRLLDGLLDYVKERKELRQEVRLRHRLADLAIEIDVARWLAYRVAWMQSQRLVPNMEASMAKNAGTELLQRVARVGVQTLGSYGVLLPGDVGAPLRGRLAEAYITTISATIAAGTSEINRSVIALRGLGLPRGQ